MPIASITRAVASILNAAACRAALIENTQEGTLTMKRLLVWLAFASCGGPAVAQESEPLVSFAESTVADPLAGNHRFDRFIGFMSNPVQNIDPRAMTAIWPIYGYSSVSTTPALPSADIQVYGAGLTVALSDKFAFGFNQGGYGVMNIERGSGPFRDRFGRLRDRREFNGDREGWLNLGGFFQYTVVENCDDQFLLTTGLRWAAPSGSNAVFQGNGPTMLAPYATLGKAWDNVHLLATAGYSFPVGSGGSTTNLFYANFHLDRQFGWFYPLVEVNCSYHQNTADIDLPTRFGFLDFGSFTSSGNLVTLAVGANAVLIPNKLELGAVYSCPLATQRNIDFDGLLVKMVYRY